MMIVLSEKELDCSKLPQGIRVVYINKHNIKKYNNNTEVVAIVGCRATAIKVNNMNFPKLKIFQLTSAGFDGVPIDDYRIKNIIVTNAGSVYSKPIAETVVYGMLQMAKKYRKNCKSHVFRLTRNYKYITELADKKVMIMGTGSIGTEIANRLIGFEMDIVGYDPFVQSKKPYLEIYNTVDDLKKNLNYCEYIISTMPDNSQTKGFIDKCILEYMNEDAVIINVGRKTVFNQEDLYNTLKDKKIKGAVLDMFEKLPNPITNKFRRLNNVIVLPGVAAISRECKERLKIHMTNNISLVLRGNKPFNIINEV